MLMLSHSHNVIDALSEVVVEVLVAGGGEAQHGGAETRGLATSSRQRSI